MPAHRNTNNGWLSIVVLLFACLLLFLWIPADTETGIIEKVRSQKSIGDAMAPTLAGGILLFGGAMLLLQTLLGQSGGEHRLSLSNLKFLACLLAIIITSFVVMRWLGPLVTPLLTGSDDPDVYRRLRDTLPWKYSGYLSGGFILVFGLMTLLQRSVRWLNLLVALLAVLALAMVYDLPFEHLLLPPNGDV